jgi:signal peptidase I
MSFPEKERLMRNLSKVVTVEMTGEQQPEYEFAIPRKGMSTEINELTLIVCKEAIMKETGDSALIRDGKLYINGEEKSSFSFNKNYFWILSEDETDGVDSRHLGLIPEDCITGNIWYCWYSKNPSHRFKKIR